MQSIEECRLPEEDVIFKEPPPPLICYCLIKNSFYFMKFMRFYNLNSSNCRQPSKGEKD